MPKKPYKPLISPEVVSTLRNPPQRTYQVQLASGLVRPYTEAMLDRLEQRTLDYKIAIRDYWHGD